MEIQATVVRDRQSTLNASRKDKDSKKPGGKTEQSTQGSTRYLLTLQNESQFLSHLLDDLEMYADALVASSTPDYSILIEIMHCLHHYPQRFMHAREPELFDILARNCHEYIGRVEELKAEQRDIVAESEWLLDELSQFDTHQNQVPDSVLRDHLLDFIYYFRSYLVSEKRLLPALEAQLSAEDWHEIAQLCSSVDVPASPENVRTITSKLAESGVRDRFDQGVRDTLEAMFIAEFTGAYFMIESVGLAQEALDEIRDIGEKELSDTLRADRATLKACEEDMSRAAVLPFQLALNHLRGLQSGIKASSEVLGNHMDLARDVASDHLNTLQTVKPKGPPLLK